MKYRPLSRKEEKRLLTELRDHLDAFLDHRWAPRAHTGLVAALVTFPAMIVLLIVVYADTWLTIPTSIGGLVVGFFLGVLSKRRLATAQWHVLGRYLDTQKIEARLRELDT